MEENQSLSAEQCFLGKYSWLVTAKEDIATHRCMRTAHN